MESTDTVEAAVAKLAATKAEHRPILTLISTDAGMAAATRKALVLHLLQEEDEQVARIAALSGGTLPAGVDAGEAAPSPAGGRKGLTVGSLRPTTAAANPARLGTLRGE